MCVCVWLEQGRSGKEGVTGKGADEGAGDGIFEAVKCVIISPAPVFLIIHPAGFHPDSCAGRQVDWKTGNVCLIGRRSDNKRSSG